MNVTPDVLVARYKSSRHTHPSLDEIRQQTLDMTRCSPSGLAGLTQREYSYPDKSDSFFQTIVDRMDW